MGLNHNKGYAINEVFTGKSLGHKFPNEEITVYLNPSGVFFGKAVPL